MAIIHTEGSSRPNAAHWQFNVRDEHFTRFPPLRIWPPHCPCVLVQRSSHCCPMAILLPSHGCPLDSSGQPSPSRSAHPRFPTKPGAVSRLTSPRGMSPAPSRGRRPAGPQGLDRRGQSDRWYFSSNLPRDHRTDRAITGPPVSMSCLVSA